MNYTDLTAALGDYLVSDSSEFQDQMEAIVGNAERAIYSTVRTPDTYATASDAVSAATFQAPADFVEPRVLLVTISGVPTPLLPKEPSFIYEAYSGITGNPRYYALQSYDTTTSATILLGPAPSGAMRYQLDYFRWPPSVVTAGQNGTWLSNNYPQALFYRCLVEGYVFLKGEADLVAKYQELADKELEKLKTHCEVLLKRDSNRYGDRAA